MPEQKINGHLDAALVVISPLGAWSPGHLTNGHMVVHGAVDQTSGDKCISRWRRCEFCGDDLVQRARSGVISLILSGTEGGAHQGDAVIQLHMMATSWPKNLLEAESDRPLV